MEPARWLSRPRRRDPPRRRLRQRRQPKGVEDTTFWAAKASDYLRGYFHAAALAGLDLRHVAAWVSGSRPEETEDILYSTAGASTHLAAQLAEMRGEANKTISTVRMTMSRALAFVADPHLAAAVLPEPGQSLDIPQFLRETGALYLIAETRGDDAPVAPLCAAWSTRSTTRRRCWAATCPAAGSIRRC